MTTRTIILTLALAFASGGCNQTLTLPGDGAGEVSPPAGETLTPLSNQRARDIAVAASMAVARTVAAALPVKDLQAIYEGGLPLPSCPSLSADIVGGDILLTLDYGGGCKPARFAAMFGGRAEGVSHAAYDSFELSMIDLSVDGESLTGTIAGRFEKTGPATVFTVTLDIVPGPGERVRGRIVVDLDDASGTLTVRDGATTMSDEYGSFTTVLSAVTLDAAAAIGPAIIAGTVTVTMLDSRGVATGESVTVLLGP